MCRLERVAIGIAALAVAGAGLLVVVSNPDAPLPSHRQIRLASRTITLDERGKPIAESPRVALAPKSTVRGTRSMLVQFEGRANIAARKLVEASGARILGVIPPHGFSIEADADTALKLRGTSGVMAVLDCAVADKLAAGLPLDSAAEQLLTVLPLSEADAARLREQVVAAKGTIVEEAGSPLRLRIRLAGTAIAELAANGEVAWIERYVRPRLLNDIAVQPGLMNVTPVWNNHGLTGSGQIITTSDTGIDTGDMSTMHVDLTNNVIGFASVNGCYNYDPIGHGTHTAGSLVGDGTATNGVVRGVAYGAKLWAWFCCNASGGIEQPYTVAELFRPWALASGTPYIHSASWGGEINCYSFESVSLDSYVWNHPDFLPVFSAGNGCTDQYGYWIHSVTSICTQAAAKNVLAVGASENLRAASGRYSSGKPSRMAYFSSRGPMPDGRIKPDLVSPGMYVCSTATTMVNSVNRHGYTFMQGTSMSCPLTAGAAALVRQWLVERRGFTNSVPTAALVKAVLMGGASDLHGEEGTNVTSPAPNKDEGWGRVNLEESLFPADRKVRLIDRVPFADGYTRTYGITLTEAKPFEVQLVLIDREASPQAALSLVNDLDLIVSNKTTGAVWYGNGTSDGDHTNNVESVRLTADEATAGDYAVSVRGTCVVCGSDEGGAAALYLRGALSDEAVEPESESYRLTVTVAGGLGDQYVAPSVGITNVFKGATITLQAEDYSYALNSNGREISRAPFLSFTGTGSVPASGTTNVVSVTMDQDSTIEWNWSTTPTEYALRIYCCGYIFYSNCSLFYDHFSRTSYNDVLSGIYFCETNSEVSVSLPESLIWGEGFDYDVIYRNGRRYSYPRHYKLGSVSTASCDEADSLVYDDKGRMPWTVAVKMNEAKDLIAYYFDTNIVWDAGGSPIADTAIGIPYWWYARYLMGGEYSAASAADVDGDGFDNSAEYTQATDPVDDASFPFRVSEFSPTNISFVGSIKGKLIVQHCAQLGGEWRGVMTNSSERTSVSNRIDLATGSMTNGFYRVIYEP